MSTAGAPASSQEAHIKLGDDPHVVPAGPIKVSDLKVLLGVSPADTLFLKEHGKRVMLSDDQVIEARSGMHFEAIGGGGVS